MKVKRSLLFLVLFCRFEGLTGERNLKGTSDPASSDETKEKNNNQQSTLIQPRIVGGSAPPRDRYPYFARVDYNFNLHCGGFLVYPDIVATAAHCVPTGGFLTAYVNAYTTYTSYSGQIPLDVVDRKIHPSYNAYSREYDVALLRLAAPVYSIDPIPLNDNPSRPSTGSTMTVMGVGDTSEGGSSSTVLHHADVFAISTNQCNSAAGYGGGVRGSTMFCAGIQEGGKDSCQGDSGGPIILQVNGQDVAMGIVSWGQGCARANRPGVYARISAFRGWMDNTISQMSLVDGPITPKPTTPPTPFPTPSPIVTTPGSCEDDPTGTFYVTAFLPNQDCQWLAQRPEFYASFCFPDTRPYDLCLRTCGRCAQTTPSPTPWPTPFPTPSPTPSPTPFPTSRNPTPMPSQFPTMVPSFSPSGISSRAPSRWPTRTPSTVPSRAPTPHPTAAPSRSPTPQPSTAPSSKPTLHPSATPTLHASAAPSQTHSIHPSATPTRTRTPTSRPSVISSHAPSHTSGISTPNPTPLPTPTPPPTLVESQLQLVATLEPTLMISVSPSKSTGSPTPIPTVQSAALAPGVVSSSRSNTTNNISFRADCDDDPEKVFFVNSFEGNQTCVWLAARPEWQSSLCVPSHPAYNICEETCLKCYDNCHEDPQDKFTVEGVVRSCLWLSLRPYFQDLLCHDGHQAYDVCLETCENCPTPQPTQAPTTAATLTAGGNVIGDSCDDNKTAQFFVNDEEGFQGCVWLEARSDWQNLLCVEGHDAYDMCEETCGKCTDSCTDSSEKFEIDGIRRDCLWLSLRLHEQEKWCQEGSPPFNICQETCDNCVASADAGTDQTASNVQQISSGKDAIFARIFRNASNRRKRKLESV